MLCQLLNLLHIFLPDRLEELQDLQVLQSHFGNWHFERRSAAKRSAVRTSFSVLIAQFQAQRYRSFVSVHILDVVGLNWIKKPPTNGTKCHRNIFTSVVVRASNNQIKATEALFLIGCWHFPKVSEHLREESEACRKWVPVPSEWSLPTWRNRRRVLSLRLLWLVKVLWFTVVSPAAVS